MKAGTMRPLSENEAEEDVAEEGIKGGEDEKENERMRLVVSMCA